MGADCILACRIDDFNAHGVILKASEDGRQEAGRQPIVNNQPPEEEAEQMRRLRASQASDETASEGDARGGRGASVAEQRGEMTPSAHLWHIERKILRSSQQLCETQDHLVLFDGVSRQGCQQLRHSLPVLVHTV